MKIDLCKIFGVEEGEEFGLGDRTARYKISDNSLWLYDDYYKGWKPSALGINNFTDIDIIKLPKKKEFTDDELDVFKKIPKKYKWCARDVNGSLYCFSDKPLKKERIWGELDGLYAGIEVFNDLFQSIQWEDEEPVFIDDYVER